MGVSCPCTAVEQGHVVLAGLVLCPGSVCVLQRGAGRFGGEGERLPPFMQRHKQEVTLFGELVSL